jgi:hypothetical protein
MKAKIEEYLFDFIEKELPAAEAASAAAEISASATLRAEVADIRAVRAEIKNTQNANAARGVDFAKLHAKIMSQVESL